MAPVFTPLDKTLTCLAYNLKRLHTLQIG